MCVINKFYFVSRKCRLCNILLSAFVLCKHARRTVEIRHSLSERVASHIPPEAPSPDVLMKQTSFTLGPREALGPACRFCLCDTSLRRGKHTILQVREDIDSISHAEEIFNMYRVHDQGTPGLMEDLQRIRHPFPGRELQEFEESLDHK
jgi:hypothetical protein